MNQIAWLVIFGLAKDISTSFPNQLDDRMFWSDVDLNHAEILLRYEKYIERQQLKEASQYIYENGDDIDWYGAYLLNKIELQIRTIGEFLLQKETHAPIFYYGSSEPTEVEENMVWIY